MQANGAESNNDGRVTRSAKDKIRHSLVFIRAEVIVSGAESGRQATLSFLGSRLEVDDLKQIELCLWAGCERGCWKTTETAV